MTPDRRKTLEASLRGNLTAIELVEFLNDELAASQKAYNGLYARYNAVLTERDKLVRVLEEIRHKADG